MQPHEPEHPFYSVSEIFYTQPHIAKVLESENGVQAVLDKYRNLIVNCDMERSQRIHIYGHEKFCKVGHLVGRRGLPRCKSLERMAVEDQLQSLSLKQLEAGIPRGIAGPEASVLQCKVNELRDHCYEVRRKCTAFDRTDFWNISEMYEHMRRLRDSCEEGMVILSEMQNKRLQALAEAEVEQTTLFGN